jgi:pilus assembly protein CpaC
MNPPFRFRIFASVLLVSVLALSGSVRAQINDSYHEVNASLDSITIAQGSSKRLKFAYDIPELMVENTEIIQATPMRSDEIMISGLQPGYSSLTVSDPSHRLQEIKVIVEIDTRPLELAFREHFPDSNIKVRALKQGIILTGFVTSPEQIDGVNRVANDFFGSNVVSMVQVQSAQNIAIQVKVYEISRTKMRRVGVDWQISSRRAGFYSSVSGLLSSASVINGNGVGQGQDFAGGILRDSTQFQAFVQFLEQRDVARLIDEPILIAKNGRPAEFLKGGEIPFLVSQGLGTNSFEFRPFGTKLDIVPLIEGGGMMTLEVRAEVSEPSDDLGRDTGLPGFRVSRVNTGVTMRTGHTLALAGHYREKNTNSIRGLPKLMDQPALGALFRRTQDDFNETELLFLITPNFIGDVESCVLPSQMPGQLTQSPSDRELFLNAHSEVPRCQDDCPVNHHLGPQMSPLPVSQPHYGAAKESPAGPVAPAMGNYPQRSAAQAPAREASRQPGFNWPANRR